MLSAPANSQATPHSPTPINSAPMPPSTSTSSTAVPPGNTAVVATSVTAWPIIALCGRMLQSFTIGPKSVENLDVNRNGSAIDITNSGTSTTSLTTAATTPIYPSNADAAAPLASARRVRGGGTHPDDVMAIIGLLFIPTLALTLGYAVMTRNTTTPVPKPLTSGPTIYILFIALVTEVIAAAADAFSTALCTQPDTETHDTPSTIAWGKETRLIARCLTVVTVVVFLIGVGSLALEYSLLGVGSSLEVHPLVK